MGLSHSFGQILREGSGLPSRDERSGCARVKTRLPLAVPLGIRGANLSSNGHLHGFPESKPVGVAMSIRVHAATRRLTSPPLSVSISPVGLRNKTARLLDRTGVLDAFFWAQKRLPPTWLTVLTYHRIGTVGAIGEADPAIVDASADEFEAAIEIVAEQCNAITMGDLRHYFRGGKLPPHPVLVTFDDGYRDNLTIAYPILKKHGVPATFFIATHFINERRVFWWDKVHALVKRSKKTELRFHLGSDHVISMRDPRCAARDVLRVAKSEGNFEMSRFLELLEEATGVSLSLEEERAWANEILMTWDEIRSLRDDGMDIQSHTRTHRILQNVPKSELASELSGARDDLRAVLGEAPYALAFPVGRTIRPFPHIRAAIRDAGYEISFSNDTGVSRIPVLDPLEIPRLGMDPGLCPAYLRAVLAIPPLHQ